MIKLFDNEQDCCGCTACKNICPQKAITMMSYDEGFLYPVINKSLCIECDLCIEVCPLKHEVNIQGHLIEPTVYAIKHKLDSVRMLSSSGGAYTAISDIVLEKKDGLCYGAEFDKDFNVHHTVATNRDERNKFRGSKYVQSELGGIFHEIKHNLIKGNSILFTGTPCQTAGLSSYLAISKIDTSHLILNDVICHGTPSPKLWNDYVNSIERKQKSKLTSFSFRFKEKGWHGYNVKAEFDNGQDLLNTKDSLKYIKLFNSNLILRPSCYYCKFANLHRPSDIMIGDFWGIEKSMPEFEDKMGISLVFVNTKRGENLFEQLKQDINYKQSKTTECMQLNLKQPTEKPVNREKFWKDYKERGFYYVTRKYAKLKISRRIKNLAKKLLRYHG